VDAAGNRAMPSTGGRPRRGRRAAPVAGPSEADLARRWAAQQFPSGALVTRDGRRVHVAYPGRLTGGAGPDFRDAVIQVGDAPPRVGDVELHRHTRDFTRHGHAADPAYDGVVLHVALAADTDATTLASGRSVPVVVAPLPASGAGPLREPCATAPSRLTAAGVRAVLAEAGRWRLRAKAGALAAAIARDGPDQALYAALATALGQTANARAFALLAARLPLAELLPAGPSDDQALTRIARRLLHAAGLDGALLAPAPALPLVTRGLRPAAHPARRILALAHLVTRLSRMSDGATPPVALAHRGQGSHAQREPHPAPAAGRGAATCPPAHVPVDALARGADIAVARALAGEVKGLPALLTVTAPDGGPALCGRARAVELAVNALLPWAAARADLAGGADRAAAILALAGGLPAARYGATAHLWRNLVDPRGRALITSALLQQGALAMLREWCARGGCGRCPLS
jgi:hypothetical protein